MDNYIKLPSNLNKYVQSGLDKYRGYSFKNKTDEDEFLNLFKEIIDDEQVFFEEKLMLLNMLCANIIYKELGIVSSKKQN